MPAKRKTRKAAKPAATKPRALDPRKAYAELLERSRRRAVFGSMGSVLGWDQRTYMPKRGAKHRGEQLSLLAGMSHEMATDPRIGELLACVESSGLVKARHSDAAVNVREWRRGYDHATKLPRKLVEALSRTGSEGYNLWVEARKSDDFKAFRPVLEKLVALAREKADALGWKERRYDALLDQYEPGATTKQVQRLFAPLEKELAALIAKIVSSGKRADPSILENVYPVPAQEALCIEAARAIGFDFDAGRLDVTTHPFCSTMGPGDVRLTTRYDPASVWGALFGTLHEAGHGLYNQGLDPKHYGTPRGGSISLGIHESQSRMWENMVGRSRAFWQFFLPLARKTFPAALGGKDLDAVYFAVNESKPSLIRVEADEATYNLHIVLRFRLEIELIEGRLKAADLPGAWSETLQKLLGLKPPSNREGCLQDVHWSGAAFGYFPTYCMGNLYAAQFCEQARADLGNLDAQFAKGEFKPLLGWLRKKIHKPGKTYRPAELCEVVTGKKLSHQPLMRYLKGKLAPLYGS
ncbi:MAG: carboxypeptidase M32 [Planctomycetota bacterium]|nr:carboxypeptidase M32 [Planctomycetota bacterium]